MNRQARSAAAAEAIWRWQQPTVDVNDERVFRRRGLVRAAVASCAAALLYGWGHAPLATVAAIVALFTATLAVTSPSGGYRGLERGLARLSNVVGRVVAWLVLLPVFFGFFVPFGLLFRRGSRDSMKRSFEPQSTTYWQAHRPPPDRPDRSRSQF